MKHQRKVSMLPHLNIAPTSFKAYYDIDKIQKIIVQGESSSDDFQKNVKENEQTITLNRTYIRIDNIGLGTAKNIKIVWGFDEEFAQKFNSFSKENHNSYISIDKTMFKYSVKSIESFYFPKNENIQYLLPATISNNPIRITIPQPYMDLFFYHVRKSFPIQQTKNAANNQFPSLNLHVQYSDIENKVFKKVFSLSPVKGFMGAPVNKQNSPELEYEISVMELT